MYLHRHESLQGRYLRIYTTNAMLPNKLAEFGQNVGQTNRHFQTNKEKKITIKIMLKYLLPAPKAVKPGAASSGLIESQTEHV